MTPTSCSEPVGGGLHLREECRPVRQPLGQLLGAPVAQHQPRQPGQRRAGARLQRLLPLGRQVIQQVLEARHQRPPPLPFLAFTRQVEELLHPAGAVQAPSGPWYMTRGMMTGSTALSGCSWRQCSNWRTT